MPSHVTGYDVHDAVESRKAVLHPPESAATKPCDGQIGIGGRRCIGNLSGNRSGNRLPFGPEVESERIEAVADPGGRRAVWKFMTQMGITSSTGDLGTNHAAAGVTFPGHMLVIIGIEEGGPTAARFELVARSKQR